jgi:hypothetical protein
VPTPYLKQVITALWPESMSAWDGVWVILDGARDPKIYGAIVGCYEEHCCLYAGNIAPELQLTAPYLVRLDKDARFTRYVINHGWGNSWGIFFRANEDMNTLRRHFRQFLVVKNERGRKLLFRYFDPRVLRVYLPTCVTSELELVFGPVSSFVTEDEDSDGLLEFRRKKGALVSQRLELSSERAETAAAAGAEKS